MAVETEGLVLLCDGLVLDVGWNLTEMCTSWVSRRGNDLGRGLEDGLAWSKRRGSCVLTAMET